MWLLTSKGRPDAAKRTIEECRQTGMTQKAILYVDGDPQGYNFTLPSNWSVIYGCGNLSGSMQYVFTAYPDEKVYGWLADDNHPITHGWCQEVERAAEPFYLVHCRDMYASEMDYRSLIASRNLGAGLCWGGELVRTVGFWSPPFLIQAGIDWFWTSLVSDTPLGVYRPDITVRHDNYRTGRREKDAVDEWDTHMQPDIDKMKKYRKSAEFRVLKKRISKFVNSAPTITNPA